MRTKIKTDPDARRTLVSVVFRRTSPDDDEPEIEAILEAHWPEDFTRTSNPIGLLILSVTRTDTREPVQLSTHEMQAVAEAATLEADTYDKSLLTR